MIICLLIPLGAVSASDVNSTADDQVLSATPSVDTLSASVNLEQENDTLSVQENENLLSAGPNSGSDNLLGDDGESNNTVGAYSDLDQIIKLSDGSLTLYSDYIFNSTVDSSPLIISKSININGNGHTISGMPIQIDADNVILNNINLDSLTYTDSVWNGHNGKIINSNITQSARFYWYGDNGIIDNTNFINLTNQFLVVKSLNLNVINSKILNFKGTSSSNIIVDIPSSGFKMIGTTIEKCTSGSSVYHGFFRIDNDAYFEGCNFTDITSGKFIFSAYPNIIFKDCNFTQMSGIVYSSEAPGVKFYGCNFYKVNNAFTDYNTLYQSIDSGTIIDHCTFVNSTGSRVLTVYGSGVQISNSLFENSTNDNCVIWANKYTTIDNCTFINNKRGAQGIIDIRGDKVVINDCTFTDNYGGDYDIVIRSDMNVVCNIDDFTKNTAIISGELKSFDYYGDLYVDNHTNGDGIGNPCNLTYAINNIYYGGTIHVNSGIYDELTTAVQVSANIIGEGKNVIINNGTFKLDAPSMKIENINFNNSKYSLQTFGSCNISNCNFTNINLNDYLILPFNKAYSKLSGYYHIYCENTNFTNFVGYIGSKGWTLGYTLDDITFKKCKFDSVIVDTLLVSTTVSNINITDCNFTTLNSGGSNTKKNNLFENITVENSKFSYLINTQAITNTLVGYAYTLNNITIKDCTNDAASLNTALVRIGKNTWVNDFKIYNLNNTINRTLFNVNGASNTIENIILNNLNTTSIFDLDVITNLNDITVDNVNASNFIDSTMFSTLDNIHVINGNFTSGIILNISQYSVIKNSEFKDYIGHIIVSGDKVEFTNTSFTQGMNPSLNGSAIEVVNGNYIAFSDCNFTKNVGLNGAVYLVNGSLRPAFLNCNFTNNYAEQKAGAIYFKYNTGVGTVVTFGGITEDTVAGFNGERLNGVYGNLTQAVSIVYVINDTEDKSGAEANAKTPLTPGTFDTAYGIAGKNCIFVFVRGGDIFNYTNSPLKGQLMDSLDEGWTFKGNNTTIENLRFHVTNGDLKAYNITFKGNDAGSVVIVDDENVLFDNCSFINNSGKSVEYGGAIQINANNTNITNCKFINNTASTDDSGYGGALYVNASYVVINNNTFDYNSAYNTGSHIYITENNQEITVNNNTFKNAYRSGSGSGSGVVIQGDNINVIGNIFDNNTGYTGSALSLIGKVNNININKNVFKNNTADGGNGAVYLSFVNGLGTDINVNNNTFDGNVAVDGGALYVDTCTEIKRLILSNNTFDDNVAVNGGAVYINVDGIALNGGLLSGNNATNGGAVYINGNNAVLNDLIFTGNNASNGGALYVNASGAKIVDCDFTYNYATNGSAIYIAKGADLTFNNINVDYNEVVNHESGFGDIYPASGSSFYIPKTSDLTLGENSYQQFIFEGTAFLIGDIYISQNGNGNGLFDKSPANLEFALNRIALNGRIHIIEDVEYAKTNLNNLSNVTIVSTGHTIKRQGTDKYLFILAIFEDHFKISVMLFFCRYSLSLILSCLIL